jgi:GTP-binding protein
MEPELGERCESIVQGLAWQAPVFRISALAGDGLQSLVYQIMNHLEQDRSDDAESA